MSFKIGDRCAVFFAGLTKGSISRKTTASLLESINKIHNSPKIFVKQKIPRKILFALEKKDKKHKELAIGLQLSILHVKEAEGYYNSGIKKQQVMLDQQQKLLVSHPGFEVFFVENFNDLGGSLKMRFDFAKELFAKKINYNSGKDIRSMVIGKEYALANKIREFKEIEESSKEKYFVINLKQHSKEYLQIKRDIKMRKLDISNLKNEARRCDSLLYSIIYSTAKKNKNLLSPQQCSLLNDLEKAIENAESAPRIIENIKENIKLLKSKRDEVSDYEDQLQNLLILKEAYVTIKETNELLKELHANNSAISFSVEKTMNEEKNKMHAVATPRLASEYATKVASSELTDSMVTKALSGLSQVHTDNNDSENKDNVQPKSRSSKLIGAVALSE